MSCCINVFWCFKAEVTHKMLQYRRHLEGIEEKEMKWKCWLSWLLTDLQRNEMKMSMKKIKYHRLPAKWKCYINENNVIEIMSRQSEIDYNDTASSYAERNTKMMKWLKIETENNTNKKKINTIPRNNRRKKQCGSLPALKKCCKSHPSPPWKETEIEIRKSREGCRYATLDNHKWKWLYTSTHIFQLYNVFCLMFLYKWKWRHLIQKCAKCAIRKCANVRRNGYQCHRK